DPHDSPANQFQAVKITTTPGPGTLSVLGVAVVPGQVVSVGDIDAGRLVFTPAADGNGAPYASFTFQVQDNGGTGNGGVDLDPTPRQLTVNVTPVNDAPVGVPDGPYVVAENTSLIVPAAQGVLTNDTDVDGPTLTAVLSAGPKHGTLTLNVDGSCTFTPDHNFVGNDHFTYRAS